VSYAQCHPFCTILRMVLENLFGFQSFLLMVHAAELQGI